MKKFLLFFFCFAAICYIQPSLAQSEMEKVIYEFSDIADIADENSFIEEAFPDFSFSDITNKLASGEQVFSFKTVCADFLKLFCNEIYLNINISTLIILLALISGMINNLQSSYDTKSVSQTAFFAFFAVFMGLTVKGLNECMTLATKTISDLVLFMKSAVPVYIALITSTGNLKAAAGMEPIFLYFIQLISSMLEKIILPMIFWISVLNIVNCLMEKFSIKRLIEFVKQLIRWGLGILMTFFVSILGMSGLTSSIAGGLGIKTMKYAVGNFVPVVGGLLSDSVDTVFASAVIIKNAMGIAGIVVLILICAIPLIKMLALIFIYKLTAGVIEPLSDKRISTMISEAGNTISFIFTVLLTITVMFIFGITIIVSVSNKFYTL